MGHEETIRIAARFCTRDMNRDIDRLERLIAMMEVSEQLGSQAIRDFETNPFKLPEERRAQELRRSLDCSADVLKPAIGMLDAVETGAVEVSEEVFEILTDTSTRETSIREEFVEFVKQDMRELRDNKRKLVAMRDTMVIDCVMGEIPRLQEIRSD